MNAKTKQRNRIWRKKTALTLFILTFCLNFAFQKIVDNEANCGVLGAPESACPYAFLDHGTHKDMDHSLGEEGEHEDHVCFSCPCNLQLSVSWDLNLYHIYINLNSLYYHIDEPVKKELPSLKGYFRPPRLSFS
ncbi:hypothetical protein LPTSP3_g03240 [Leptospira kobayashii]|uniref:Lipoprotein n=1 Tax=Leptospira kobayashii TaxID=1917830 RepID=A0ABM7UG36_9LEPT|nr:hypothetical protein [Leptospira kobayashii]BDA77394.1 hypothetical protein LPTSP3_g03240 [Leptospira kobayashii]